MKTTLSADSPSSGRPGEGTPDRAAKPMTASDCTPEEGNESGGTECTITPFEQFARREIATLLRMQPTYVEEASRSIADDVEQNEEIDREDAVEVRKQARELLRLTEGVVLASGSASDPDREALSGEAHSAGHEVHQAVLDLDRKVLNEESIERRDLERVFGWIEELEEAVVEIAEKMPREDD